MFLLLKGFYVCVRVLFCIGGNAIPPRVRRDGLFLLCLFCFAFVVLFVFDGVACLRLRCFAFVGLFVFDGVACLRLVCLSCVCVCLAYLLFFFDECYVFVCWSFFKSRSSFRLGWSSLHVFVHVAKCLMLWLNWRRCV